MKFDPFTAENAQRFNWWWRGLFVRDAGPAAIGLFFEPKIIAPSVRWSEKPDIGSTFRSLYAGFGRSARLYELERRVAGKYRFEVPWIELDDEKRKALLKIWPDRLPESILRSSISEFPAEPGWTAPQWLSWNLGLNDSTLVESFRQFIKRERSRSGLSKPKPNEGTQRRPSSWRAIECLDLEKIGLLQTNDSQRSQINKAKKELKDSLQNAK